MSTEAPLDRPLDRRLLLRGGAVLAGAAGVTAVGAAIAPSTADAADGGNVVLGQENDSGLTTTLRIDHPAGGADPPLTLSNANGPSLALQALHQDWDGPLEVGQIANTVAGPNIGVNYDGDDVGTVTTFLATGMDLTNAYPVPPARLLDTRSAASRAAVVGASSGSPFDPIGRLKGGQYLDVAVAATWDFTLIGMFLNVTAYRPVAGGYLEVYTPGARPGIPTLPYQRLVTVANSVFVGPEVSKGVYTVRVFASKTCTVQLDLLGLITGFPPTGQAAAAAPTRRLAARQAKQRDRLIASVRSR